MFTMAIAWSFFIFVSMSFSLCADWFVAASLSAHALARSSLSAFFCVEVLLLCGRSGKPSCLWTLEAHVFQVVGVDIVTVGDARM